MTADDADAWLRSQLRGLLADESVERLRLVALGSPSRAWQRQWDHLIEIDLRETSDPGAVISGSACADLLGDLHLLGMRPTVLVADDDRAIALVRDEG